MRYRVWTIMTGSTLFFLGAALFFPQEATAREPGSRLIDHAMGETRVPDAVERIVTLEWTYTENVLALGMQPVGVADIAGYEAWVDIPVALSRDVVDVGSRQEPNLELIIALEPDLIITSTLRAAENYDELTVIAPTLAFDPYPADGSSQYDEMVSTFTTIAEGLGKSAQAQAVLSELQRTYDRAAGVLAAAELSDNRFVLAQTYLSGESPVFRLFTDNAMAVEIIARIGLENTWEDAPGQYGFSTVDFEGFAGMEAVNFLYIAQPDAREAITGAPVWRTLPFVRSGSAHWLGSDVWLFGGPLSAIELVEAITEALPARE